MQFSALKKLPLEGMALFSFFSLLGVYASYPLIKFLRSALPYTLLPAQNAELLPLVPGDHLQVYYWFWLLKDNLFGVSSLFTNPYEFNIAGIPISQGYVQFPYSLLFIPLSVFGNITAHNLLVLLSFPFSGLAMFYSPPRMGRLPFGGPGRGRPFFPGPGPAGSIIFRAHQRPGLFSAAPVPASF